ncbi:hypothetical protein ACTS93_13985 [Empedobacter falsenii]
MSNKNIIKEIFRSRDPLYTIMNFKDNKFKDAYMLIHESYKHPIGKLHLKDKNLTPNSYTNLRNIKKTYFFGNLEGEIAWMLNVLTLNVDKIKLFIEKEDEFQFYLLKNNNAKAFSILEEINDEVCYSYWGLENTFSIKDKIVNSKENWDFLKEINSNVTNNLTLLFAEFFSKKAEKEVSTFQFKREIENLINGLDEKDTEIFIFKLGNVFFNKFKYLAEITFIESQSSIIDQYLFLLEILYYLHFNNDNHLFIKQVLDILLKLNIKDSRINRLLELILQDKNLNDFNFEILDLFEIYTQGDYKKSLKVVQELLVNYPNCVELYEIYVKSLIELEYDFIKTDISKNIDDILDMQTKIGVLVKLHFYN